MIPNLRVRGHKEPPALPGTGALLRHHEEGRRGAGPEMPGAYRRGDRRPVRRPPEPCGGMDLQGHGDAAGGEAHRMTERWHPIRVQKIRRVTI